MEQKTSSKKFYFIIAIIALLIASLCFYFFYYIKTPLYSLQTARNAFENHDLVTFEKHVDIESLVSNAFDDIDISESITASEDIPFAGLAKSLIKNMKGIIIVAFVDEIRNNIKTPVNNEATNEKTRNIKEKINFNDTKLKSIENYTIEGDTATIDIVVSKSSINEDLTLKLIMRKLDDGTWQAYKISNFKDLLNYQKK